jgi:hypothetical protein
MTHWLLPNRQQRSLKMMCLPSGDQSGLNASSAGAVKRCWVPPFASVTHTAESRPSWFESKAIFVPSGDQSGLEARQAELVSCMSGPVPSDFTRLIAQLSGPAQRVKAISLSSGEKRGLKSSKPGSLSNCVRPEPVAFIS